MPSLRAAGLALGLLAAAGPAVAQTPVDTVVTLQAGQSIRDLAAQHLGDPDLWPEILKASRLQSITEIRPETELRIPTGVIAAATEALDQSLVQIQAANTAGAQIFAPDEIGSAIDLHEAALLKRTEREWEPTRTLAVESGLHATSALQKSEASRDLAAEALIADRQGDVEGQRPEDLSWRGLAMRSILIEEEKVRTLSDSTALITFRDASRLRLNANSNAIIQRLRYDPLKRTEEARVSLVEGDFYALLSGDESGRKSFAVDIPDVDANITSGSFWVGNSADGGAKFANYDDRVVQVSAGGETVILGKNEGTVVGADQRPSQKTAVLAAPDLTSPGDTTTVFVANPTLAWSAIPHAAGYWLELASDPNFDRMVVSRFGLETNEHPTEQLAPGSYYWRVAALDVFGLPGARSPTFRVEVAKDDVPPFLSIGEPAADAILRQPSVTITGESEAGAVLTVNGEAVPVGPDGHFTFDMTLTEGVNVATALARDPAGNQTSRERRFTYMQDAGSAIVFDATLPRRPDGEFVTDQPVISLAGGTTPNATLEFRPVNSPEIRASSVAAADGRFLVNLPLAAEAERFTIAVVAQSGFTITEEIGVAVDSVPPVIALDSVPLRLTSVADLVLAGPVDADVSLTVNGAPAAVSAGRFAATVTLQPGANDIELTATDLAGNVTIEKWSVTLDANAPSLVSSRLVPAGGDRVTVEVVADDATGLAKIAPVTVVSGTQQYAAHLRYNRAAKAYQGTIAIPAAAQPAAVISRVELEDDAGNRQVFELN